MDHPAAGPAPRPPSPEPYLTAGETLRRLTHVGVAFLSLFLIVRSFALEPFGVPTGSMAETLYGNRREGACPRCGHPVRVGQPSRERAARFDDCRCPNCAAPVDLSNAPEVPGDRLLVDKNVFSVRCPRRWEVAVFRCPVDLSKPYVKRVVGLPGEAVRVIDGDVYANGELLRKTLAEVRQTRVPFFDMSYAPADGWGARWLVEPVADEKLPVARKPAEPAGPDVLRDGMLTLNAADGPGVGLTYHHYQFEVKDDDPVRDALTYNDAVPVSRRAVSVHDFVAEFDLEVVKGSGAFACRLGDGADHVSAELPIGPLTQSGDARAKVRQDAPAGSASAMPEAQGAGPALNPGRVYRVEFAFVDRRVSLAIDGMEAVSPLDLPSKADRGGVRRPLQIGARGVEVRVRNLKLFHDIHYRADGPNANKSPCRLGPDEYFMLGDNSPDSHDSRGWAIPGVPERDFIGKPFLIHQPMKLGRVTVNGNERVFQAVDWDRLRLVR